jgi:ankyrin repeat protein
MGYLTNFLKNKITLPNIPLKELFSTSSMAKQYYDRNLNKIEKLLKKGKSHYKNIKFRENYSYSMLSQAVVDNDKEVVELILKQPYGKDTDIIEDIDNELGLAPIHLACMKPEPTILHMLIEKGNSRLKVKTKSDDLSILHVAAQVGSLNCLDFVYRNYFYKNINIDTDELWKPLHFSCFHNRLDITSYLIDNGGDLYARNSQFLTPIEICVINDNLDLTKILWEFHYSPEKLYSFERPETAKITHIAASSKKGTKCLQYFLEDINHVHDICNSSIKATPLHFACMQENANAVRLLCQRGANPNIPDYLGNSPLMYVVENKNLEIIKILHDYGADALRKNYDNLSPLQVAVHQGNKNIKLFFLGQERYKKISESDLM